MTYRIELSDRAVRDICNAHDYIRKHGPANPDVWVGELQRKLASLERLPEACGFAPENDFAAVELRQMFHGPFRIVFTIRGTVVYVVTVRHGARRPLSRRNVRAETRPPE
jgi:plasmid stabilization system protein ParE